MISNNNNRDKISPSPTCRSHWPLAVSQTVQLCVWKTWTAATKLVLSSISFTELYHLPPLWCRPGGKSAASVDHWEQICRTPAHFCTTSHCTDCLPPCQTCTPEPPPGQHHHHHHDHHNQHRQLTSPTSLWLGTFSSRSLRQTDNLIGNSRLFLKSIFFLFLSFFYHLLLYKESGRNLALEKGVKKGLEFSGHFFLASQWSSLKCTSEQMWI